YGRFNSVLARLALRVLFRPGRSYRLWFGPLRGLQLFYDRSVNFHAILGLWDLEIFELLNTVLVQSRLLAKDAIVADVGANIGVYTLWLSTHAVGRGHVYAFEPSVDVLEHLSKNLELNNISN